MPIVDELELQEQRERTTPEIAPRVYLGSAIEADERQRLEDARAIAPFAVMAAIVLLTLFCPRGPWWPVP